MNSDYECLCSLNYNGTNCEVYTGEGVGLAGTFAAVFSVFFTALLSTVFAISFIRKRNQSSQISISSKTGVQDEPKINPEMNFQRNRPFLRRGDAMLSDPFNPENDLFKNARRQKTTGNHVVNNDRVVTQKAWNGDPDEEFHWHDRRRRKRTETVSFSWPLNDVTSLMWN